MSKTRSATAAVGAMLVLACGGGNGGPVAPPPPPPPPPPLPSDVSFALQVQPRFTRSCAISGCHAGSTPPVGLSLEAGASYPAIVDIPAGQLATMDRIEPGDPDNSYLIHKLRGTHIGVGGSGGRMPLGAALPQATIDTIVVWVSEGAIET